MNKGHFWGHLSKDPDELKRYGGDKVKGRLYVAVRRRTKNEDGTYSADFIPVTTWGKTAENCARFLRKGSPICVEYHLQSGSYDDQDGKRHFTLDVVADAIEFLPSRHDNDNPSSSQAQGTQGTDPDSFTPINIPDDELPF